MRFAIITLFIFPVACAFGQNFDTSNNAALHGDYFAREILIAGENTDGTITTASSAIGVATFDGAGHYTFSPATGSKITGVYGLGANGLLYIQSLIDGTQYAYGGLSGVGPTAFVASATEGASGDILIAIPAGSAVTSASLSGNYIGGYVSFPNADVTQVREASLSFHADGAGNLSAATVSGTALNLGGSAVQQTITGASYSLTGEGSGALNLGSASPAQVLSGSLTFYLSADGNLFLAGTPGGYDLIVGSRAFSGSASNSTWNQVYFTGALEDTVSGTSHSIDAFYGSWNADGKGDSVAHDRYQSLAQPQQVSDYTFSSEDAVQSNGTSTPTDVPYQFNLAAGGQVFIGTGTQGLYSLLVGFAAPKYSASGVYLNPLGVVNSANFAPITNPIAPGEIVALFGSGLAAASASAPGLPLPTSLGGVQVTINGEQAPLFYVTPGQIAVQVPQDITPGNNIANATIQVINNGALSNAVTVYTNYTAPGVFTIGSNGIGPAAAELANYSVITQSNPATPGSSVLLYGTGLGQVNPAVPNGAAAPSNPPAEATDSDAVYVGDQQGTITFNGLTPGLAGLFQVNVTVAQQTPSGADFADIATPDAYTSAATLAVGSSAASRPAVEKPLLKGKHQSSTARRGLTGRASGARGERE